MEIGLAIQVARSVSGTQKSCCDSFLPPVHWKQSRRAPEMLLRTATAWPSERMSDFMQPDSGQFQAALLNAWNLKDLKAQNDSLLGSKQSKQARCHALTNVPPCHTYGCTSPWGITNTVKLSVRRPRTGFRTMSQCRDTFLCSCWARPRCDRDAESLVHEGSAQAKVAWGCSNLENSSTVWFWGIHVFTNRYPSIESSPHTKKTQRWWRESFQCQEQIHERA